MMEPLDEKAQAQESARGGTRPLGRLGPQHGQTARQQTKRPQGRPGHKPQEDPGRQTQRPPAATWTTHQDLGAVITAIRARFGCLAIGFGQGGIRYSASTPR